MDTTNRRCKNDWAPLYKGFGIDSGGRVMSINLITASGPSCPATLQAAMRKRSQSTLVCMAEQEGPELLTLLFQILEFFRCWPFRVPSQCRIYPRSWSSNVEAILQFLYGYIQSNDLTWICEKLKDRSLPTAVSWNLRTLRSVRTEFPVVKLMREISCQCKLVGELQATHTIYKNVKKHSFLTPHSWPQKAFLLKSW